MSGEVGDVEVINSLAAEIRRVDGDHSLGAGALAEALMPWFAAHVARVEQEWRDVAFDAIEKIRDARESARDEVVAAVEEVVARAERHTEVEQGDVEFRDADTGVWWDVAYTLRAALAPFASKACDAS